MASFSFTDSDLFFILGALLGCLLPDSDHKEAIAGYIFPLHLIFKHGKQTHTLIAVAIILATYTLAKHEVILGIAFGFFNHLCADHWSGNKLKYLYYPFTLKGGNKNYGKR